MYSPEIAAEACKQWLISEETYQFGKYGPPNADNLNSRINIVLREVPERWHRFRVFRGGEAHQQATQAILKTCASARAGAMLDLMRRGGSDRLANWATLNDLSNVAQVYDRYHEVFHARLTMPFDLAMGGEVYGDESMQRGYLAMAGLAVAQLIEVADKEHGLWLPEPGHRSGDIVAWDRTF